tara:strand:- start:146 stop:1585 length:1440 start_codon:yes stop_codon:yes gene_type:complete
MIFPSFEGLHVVVVGDLMLDRYWSGPNRGISQEAPVPVINVTDIQDYAGGAANVAMNVVALGGDCTLIGITGSDEGSEKLRMVLEESGVNCDFVESEEFQTVIKLRVVSNHQQLLRTDFESLGGVDENLGKQVSEKLKEYLSSADVLVIQDYDKGAISRPEDMIAEASKYKVPVVVDPKCKSFHRYAGAKVIKPNLREFEFATGVPFSSDHFLETATDVCIENHFEFIAVTRGVEGSTMVSSSGDVRHFRALPVDVFDVTGAGDTTAAVLALGIALDTPLELAMEMATIAGSIVVSKVGTSVVTELEFSTALSGFKGGGPALGDYSWIKRTAEVARMQGKKIVFTNGCFDVLHAGHVRYLDEARTLGDLLIVAINDDESVRQLKGGDRPINQLEHRASVLKGLRAVDCVVTFSEDTPDELLRLIRPDILVKGGDYKPDEVIGAEIVSEYGGAVHVLTLVEGLSTTQILKKLSTDNIEIQ